jgi:5-methylcytosine-specific restriction endonuclease McrA
MPKQPSVSPKQILKLIESQHYRCALSGRELTPETASLDHAIPLSRGGAHDITNVQCLDYRVNAAKGTMTVEEFVAMCCDVARQANGVALA